MAKGGARFYPGDHPDSTLVQCPPDDLRFQLVYCDRRACLSPNSFTHDSEVDMSTYHEMYRLQKLVRPLFYLELRVLGLDLHVTEGYSGD